MHKTPNLSAPAWRMPRRALIAAPLLALALAGCVVTPPRAYIAGPTVAIAPPPPRPEVVGVAPGYGYVWIGGFWNWVGDRHVWVSGHWDAPHPGYRWVPHHWERDRDGWRLRGGRWER